MNRNLYHKRKNYDKFTLEDKTILLNPYKLFDEWYNLAEKDANIIEANCMTLSTVYLQKPQNRVVLMKEYSEKGFVFYTNYLSRKGKAIAENPEVCLSFFWPSLEKQIIINGKADKVSLQESLDYFHSRPIESRAGAVASQQSEVIPNRELLENTVAHLIQSGKKIEKPDHWGGYRVVPYRFEFWQGRPNRLHDRIEYNLDMGEWKHQRLSP